jgi:hypothetical protein
VAYTAKCDTAVATKWWITGTGSSINRLSEVMDDNASGVEEDDNPGNYQPWSTFMTEHVEDKVYQVHLKVEMGDGSTSTTLTSESEAVFFDSVAWPKITANATLTLGELHNSWGRNGSYWSVYVPNQTDMLSGGTFNMYGSTLKQIGSARIDFSTGTLAAYNSQFHGDYANGSPANNIIYFQIDITSLTLSDVVFSNWARVYFYEQGTLNDVMIHDVGVKLAFNSNDCEIENVRITDVGQIEIFSSGTLPSVRFMNPAATIEGITKVIGRDGCYIAEEYSININIGDKDGTALPSATVAIEDNNAHAVATEETSAVTAETVDTSETGINVSDGTQFSAADVIRIGHEYMTVDSISSNTLTVTRATYGSDYPAGGHFNGARIYKVGDLTTDASGDTPKIWLPYKFWMDTAVTEFAPIYKFTISRAGYETFVLDNITITGMVDWHLELQPRLQSVLMAYR